MQYKTDLDEFVALVDLLFKKGLSRADVREMVTQAKRAFHPAEQSSDPETIQKGLDKVFSVFKGLKPGINISPDYRDITRAVGLDPNSRLDRQAVRQHAKINHFVETTRSKPSVHTVAAITYNGYVGED